MPSMASCVTSDVAGGVSDVPVTAIACPGQRGDVYFAASNTVRHSSAALAQSTCIATAPPSTTISVIAVAHLATSLSRQPLVFMGAADRLLAQCAVGDSSAFSCCVVLKTDEGRVLSVAVDEERDVVLVLTASNDVFCGRLHHVADAVLTHSRKHAAATAPSGTPRQQPDLSRHCAFARVCGPRLGVVLAADCLVRCSSRDFSPDRTDGASLAEWDAYRLFAATYAGTVVEWHVARHHAGAGGPPGASQPRRAPGTPSAVVSRVVSRVQAHAAGCAIFAARVAETMPRHAQAQSSDGVTAALVVCTHLVTCSDDRSVALYERRRPLPGGSRAAASADHAAWETEWVLLWRGGGVGERAGAAGFARGRVFDVALHVRWAPCADVEGGGGWRCVVSVGVAGEDGAVQAVEVVCRGVGGAGAAAHVMPRLVCPRQHRGHGAYRVAFAENSTGPLTLVSGGFDGVLLSHSLPHTEQRHHGGGAEAHVPLCLRTAALRATPSCVAEVASEPARSSPKGEQVRIVHVDVQGRVLACTADALCVRCDEGALDGWWIPLPRTATSPSTGGGADHGGDWGLPATLDTLAADCAVSSSSGRHTVPVACALVGTTAGALCLLPYAAVTRDGAASSHGSRPVQRASTAGAPSPLLASLMPDGLGKVTHIAVLRVDTDTSSAGEFLVASSHVRNTVVLSRLVVTLAEASRCTKESECFSDPLCLQASATWQTITLYADCPGPLTTTLTLLPTGAKQDCRSGNDGARDCGDGPLPVWLLVGDRNGCLLGTRPTMLDRRCGGSTATPQTIGPLNGDDRAPTKPLHACAEVHRYIFAAHLRLAIVAVCAENVDCYSQDGSAVSAESGSPSPTVMLMVAGTGGAVAFVYLPDAASSTTTAAAGPLPATAREPLRLPFEVTSVLAMTPRVLVVQSGTAVSVLHRAPGQSSWVPVGSCDGVRAPRLVTARVTHVSSAAASALDARLGGALVFFAHCSDGRTVERVAAQCGTAAGALHPLAGSTTQRRVRLLHGAGLPGKDYNCVAYAPAPLRCLLMGNEDSSLALYPLRAGKLTRAPRGALVCDGLDTPLNVCGAHHSNILAIAVLPQQDTSAVRFVTVGGGAMVNLWAADAAACPLQLLDWWCGGAAPNVEKEQGGGGAVEDDRRASAARFQKRRERPSVTASAAAAAAAHALTDRIARFMAVAALSATEVAVGSSDGTLLHFAVADVPSSSGGGTAALRLLWQGVLNPARPKPVMCVSHVPDSQQASSFTASPLLLAGDTNGVVYVLELAMHTVVAQARLEQSCVNALSEVHRVSPTAVVLNAPDDDHVCWHAASLHDSGVVHLLRLQVRAGSVHIRLLSSVSTGVTAGRSVRWPAASLPLVAVTEERAVEFDATAAQRGELRVSRTQRVNVRCVSGAAVIAEAEENALATEGSLRVAVVGQGFHVVDWACAT